MFHKSTIEQPQGRKKRLRKRWSPRSLKAFSEANVNEGFPNRHRINLSAGFHVVVPVAQNGALSHLSLIHQFAQRSGLFYENRRKELGSHRVQIKHRGGDTAKTRLSSKE